MSGDTIGENGTKKTSAHEKHAESKPQGSLRLNSHNDPHHTNEERCPQKPNWVDVGTLVALILAFLAAVYAGCEAKRLADATDILVSDEKDTAKRQLRAYVYASPYRAFHIDNLGGVVQVYTVIGSNGSTFAKKVERSVGISLLPGPVPEKFEDLGSLKREEGVLVLAPGAKSIVIQDFRKITEEELAKIMTENGDLRIYAFGKITYEDAFGTPHQTTFCHAYFGSERLAFNGGFAYEHWQAKSCDRHNDAN